MASIQYGIVLPYGSPKNTSEQACAAEEAGWDGVFVGDAIWCLDPLIQLSAAAMLTSRVKLGTMVIPAPLRVPWQLASQTLALDLLSNGRFILGMGTGATWMGWQSFPDVVVDTKTRAEMLDEMIDVLSLMYKSKQFDYNGKHYHLKLTLMEEKHYPPPPIQQPRIPIWIPGVVGRKKSMQRVLKCDGIFPLRMDKAGKIEDVTPTDVCELKAYVDANRTLTTPFDIVVEGKTEGLDAGQAQAKIREWRDVGVTWWVESTWGISGEQIFERIRRGPLTI